MMIPLPDGHYTRRVKRVALPLLVCALLLVCAPPVSARRQTAPPHLRRQGTATQLVVDGRPFLIRGGELGNSSSSSLEYMRPLWPKLAALKLNTVVVTFAADSPGAPEVGILWAQEGRYVDGRWTQGRWLNGDQTHQGRHIRLPSGGFDIQRVKLYRYR
jgi:hypothetical protein